MAFDIDKEVQNFGPYKLVIRHPKGAKACAVLWRGGEKLAFAEGETKEQAYDEMLRLVGIQQLEKAKAQGVTAPAVEKVTDAFRFLWRHLNDAQRSMLEALHAAPGQEMSTTALAKVARYRSHSGVNLWLGRAGAMFAQECPRADMHLNKEGSPVATSWFCTWDDPKGTWTLRPEVAESMRLAHCVQ